MGKSELTNLLCIHFTFVHSPSCCFAPQHMKPGKMLRWQQARCEHMKNCELGGKRANHDKTKLTRLQKIWATIFSLLPSSSSCSPSEPCPAPGVKFENKIQKCETHPSWSSTALHLFHHVLKTTHACKITFSRLST